MRRRSAVVHGPPRITSPRSASSAPGDRRDAVMDSAPSRPRPRAGESRWWRCETRCTGQDRVGAGQPSCKEAPESRRMRSTPRTGVVVDRERRPAPNSSCHSRIRFLEPFPGRPCRPGQAGPRLRDELEVEARPSRKGNPRTPIRHISPSSSRITGWSARFDQVVPERDFDQVPKAFVRPLWLAQITLRAEYLIAAEV